MYEQQLDRLIVRISGGDDDALAELYEKTNRGVFAFLYSYLDNREDSEDAMQDVYLKVKLHAGSYRQGPHGGGAAHHRAACAVGLSASRDSGNDGLSRGDGDGEV